MFSAHYLGAVYCVSLFASLLYLFLQGRTVASDYLGETLQLLAMRAAPLLPSPAPVPLRPARQAWEPMAGPAMDSLIPEFPFPHPHPGSQGTHCAADHTSGEPQKQRRCQVGWGGWQPLGSTQHLCSPDRQAKPSPGWS